MNSRYGAKTKKIFHVDTPTMGMYKVAKQLIRFATF